MVTLPKPRMLYPIYLIHVHIHVYIPNMVTELKFFNINLNPKLNSNPVFWRFWGQAQDEAMARKYLTCNRVSLGFKARGLGGFMV